MKEIEKLMSIRASRADDFNFIMATWLRGAYYGNPWFAWIDKDIFMHRYHVVLEKLLDKPEVGVAVACLQDDPDTILGYSVVESNILHWVYVKESWRKMGIAKSLVPKTIDTTTHLTMLGHKIMPESYKFNPFAI